MLIKHLIDLARINVFATANDHVRLSIDNVKKSVRIAITNVAGVKPAVAKRGVVGSVVLVITFENVLAALNDLAELTLGHFAIFFVNDAHLVADRKSARTGTTSLIRRIERRATRRLR